MSVDPDRPLMWHFCPIIAYTITPYLYAIFEAVHIAAAVAADDVTIF